MTLEKDLARFAEKPKETSPYEKHSLLRNPFPGYGEPPIDVCTDQEPIKDNFIDVLQELFLRGKAVAY